MRSVTEGVRRRERHGACADDRGVDEDDCEDRPGGGAHVPATPRAAAPASTNCPASSVPLKANAAVNAAA
jgi:hypothetical protein